MFRLWLTDTRLRRHQTAQTWTNCWDEFIVNISIVLQIHPNHDLSCIAIDIIGDWQESGGHSSRQKIKLGRADKMKSLVLGDCSRACTDEDNITIATFCCCRYWNQDDTLKNRQWGFWFPLVYLHPTSPPFLGQLRKDGLSGWTGKVKYWESLDTTSKCHPLNYIVQKNRLEHESGKTDKANGSSSKIFFCSHDASSRIWCKQEGYFTTLSWILILIILWGWSLRAACSPTWYVMVAGGWARASCAARNSGWQEVAVAQGLGNSVS